MDTSDRLRGALIVIEGLDRSGKSTQCANLVDALRSEGTRAELMRFPDRNTAIGAMIDSYLRNQTHFEDHAVHLLFSANRWELQRSMRDKIHDGITLIVDRYVYSGAAFSAAKGLPLEWCRASDTGLPKPDKVFFLDVHLDIMQRRGDFGRERYESRDMQRKTAVLFATLRNQPGESWQTIDASQSVEDVKEQLLHYVHAVLKNVGSAPLESIQ